jgi:RNA polymerase sigma-70 factor (ECF subfamily)
MNYSSLSCDQLIRACADSGNFEAWDEFLRRFGKQISLVIWRVARQYGEKNNAVVEDLRQEILKKLCEDDCRLLREFNPHHEDAFYGMLRVMAANVAHDYFRARDCEKRGSGRVNADLDDVYAPAAYAASAQIERQVLLLEIEETLRAVCPEQRDREIFWLHYRQGFTANAIAETGNYDLGAKGVETLLHRLRALLRTALGGEGALE